MDFIQPVLNQIAYRLIFCEIIDLMEYIVQKLINCSFFYDFYRCFCPPVGMRNW